MRNIQRTLFREIRYPKDIRLLRELIPRLCQFTDMQIQELYEAYSDTLSAGWLDVETSIQAFKIWLDQ